MTDLPPLDELEFSVVPQSTLDVWVQKCANLEKAMEELSRNDNTAVARAQAETSRVDAERRAVVDQLALERSKVGKLKKMIRVLAKNL